MERRNSQPSVRVELVDERVLVREGPRRPLESRPEVQVVAAAATGEAFPRQVEGDRRDVAVARSCFRAAIASLLSQQGANGPARVEVLRAHTRRRLGIHQIASPTRHAVKHGLLQEGAAPAPALLPGQGERR